MKRNIIKIIVGILILLNILMIFSTTSESITGEDKIGNISLSEGSIIEPDHPLWKSHVFCIEHGGPYSHTGIKYTVGAKKTLNYTTKDSNGNDYVNRDEYIALLAMLYNNLTESNETRPQPWGGNKGQLALWWWIENNESLADELFDGVTINKKTYDKLNTDGGDIGDYTRDCGGKCAENCIKCIYNKQSANNYNSHDNSQPAIANVRIEGSDLKFNISGATKYDIDINGRKYTRTSQNTNSLAVTIPLNELTVNGDRKYVIKVTGKYDRDSYAVEYRTLTPEGITAYISKSNNLTVSGNSITNNSSINYNIRTSKNTGNDNNVIESLEARTSMTFESVSIDGNWYRVVLGRQKILVITNVSKGTQTIGKEVSSEIDVPADVSLQKYITKVTDANGNITYDGDIDNDGVYDRVNKYAKRDDDLGCVGVLKHQGKPIFKGDYGGVNDTAPECKSKNPVEIEQGDTVEYTIKVYNNNNTATKASLADRIAGGEIINIVSGTDKYTNDGNDKNDTITLEEYKGNEYITNSSNIEYSDRNIINRCRYYNIKVNNSYTFELGANEVREFKVYVRYDSYLEGEISNKVWITWHSGTRSPNYRTIDADYVTMDSDAYSVSLEKYVTEVTDIYGNNRVAYNEKDGIYQDRSGKRHNENLNDGDKDKNPYKFNNRVSVEPGDIVTYTIRLKNTGEKSVKIKTIYDVYWDDYNDGNVTLNLCDGQNESLVVYNQDGKELQSATIDISSQYLGPNGNWRLDNVDERYLINFNDPTLLEPDEYIDVKIKFKVNVTAGTDTKVEDNTIYNKAGIIQIQNKNNVSVTDSDGDANNYDQDFLKIKEYKVSLEKYITEVTDGFGNNRVTYNEKDGIYQDRRGKRYNEYAEDKNDINNYNPYKYNNRVPVEAGDIVTFKIVLKNTGETPVKVTQIYDVFTNMEIGEFAGMKLTYQEMRGETNPYIIQENYLESSGEGEYNDGQKCDRYLIKLHTPKLLVADETTEIEVKFKVEIVKEITDKELKSDTDAYNNLYNKATIVEIQNRNDVPVKDSDGTDNNTDMDFLVNKLYEVSLEKYVSEVNGEKLKDINANVNQRPGKPEHKNDNDENTTDNWKHDNVVTVKNDDTVTYTIIVRNDSKDTSIKISKIIDNLPQGVEYVSVTGAYKKTDETDKLAFELVENGLIAPGGSKTFEVTVKVTEPNISLNVLKNTAYIDEESLTNRNEVTVKDLTGNNNSDSDYIQLDDIILSGFVWNDIAWDKKQITYNGSYEEEHEKPLSNIPVFLYCNGQNGIKGNVSTDKDGKYEFTIEKGPKVNGTNRWEGTYYSYSVVFGYDGITYTPTTLKDGQNCLGIYNNDYNDSNAQENEKVREDFNKKFATINNENRIEYSTKNESGYMPESNHISNEDMKTWAYTNDIELENTSEREEQLKHVNLGLRGRDIFDLELTTDVHSTKVTVNGVKGVYQYSNNKVVLRRDDLSNSYNYLEDMANTYAQKAEFAGESYDQGVRETDIGTDDLEIEVTYKITVQNVSKTDGTATVITDYFDNKYEFIKAYVGDYEMTIENKKATYGNNGTGYKSVVLTTPATNLTQNDTMEIFVVFKLSNANKLKDLLNGAENLPTFNIAEITEYTTRCANEQTEFTRGLIDKDSAPGSINKETVRLDKGTSNLTTLNYYYQKAQAYLNNRNNKDLNNLKYEDDTCAAPILYFTASDQQRTLTGIVFEDKTQVNSTTKIKTGNGKLDNGEVGIYGATVELIEQKAGGKTDKTTTDKEGRFSFSGFLPGNYIIKYSYGNTTNTVLLHQDGDVNKQSYNGEDYQATNNSYNIEGMDTNQLNKTTSFWYVYNESDKISTAKDNVARRNSVTQNALKFTDSEMTILNNMRDMVGIYNKDTDKLIANEKYNTNKTELLEIAETEITGIKDVMDKTSMYATTDTMLFTVEETVDLNKLENKDLLLAQNKITITRQDNEKGILLGEWAIFPDNSEDSPYKSYKIENMNFGIAEVPVTTLDLKKEVIAFSITDSTGKNVIASVSKQENGKWKLKGDVLPLENTGFDVSIEDEKLQGARLQITYQISSEVKVTKNFDNTSGIVATINELIDYIDNNLSYNESLGENSRYWELTTYNEIFADGTKGKGTVDPNRNKYTTIVKAKANNPILKNLDYATATITLEKVLSSTNSTFEDIVTSTVDIYAYNNIVEITELNYGNVTSENPGEDPGSNPGGSNPDETVDVRKDLIRTPDRYIPIAKKQHDTATSGIVTIHPPTGDNSLSINYYIIAVIVLAIIAAGAYGIKKFVVKK